MLIAAMRSKRGEMMRIVMALIAVCIVAAAFRNAIKKWPAVWYLVACVACLAYFAYFFNPELRLNYGYVMYLKIMQRGTLGFSLITVVMLIGVLPASSGLRLWLVPIRRQLSIAGCIMLVPHVVFYGRSYLASGVFLRMDNVSVSLFLACVLVALGLVLFITSFVPVKRLMNPRIWKKVQRVSYVFYGMTFIHLLLFLMPSAFAGRAEVQVAIAVYCILGFGYAVLRITRYVCETGDVRVRQNKA